MRLPKFVVFERAEGELVKTIHRPNAEFQQPKLRHHVTKDVDQGNMRTTEGRIIKVSHRVAYMRNADI